MSPARMTDVAPTDVTVPAAPANSGELPSPVFVFDPTDPTRSGVVLRTAALVSARLTDDVRAGRAVAYIPLATLVSLYQAADFLDLPITQVRGAVADGSLPVADSRDGRVRFHDLLAFHDARATARRRALDELTAIDRELGLRD